MEVVQKPLEELKPYENNPRVNEDAVKLVADSIKSFGFNQPIVVDENNVIVVGHTRYLASKKLRLSTVPVYVLKGLSEEQYKAYRLVDNRTAEYSYWDWGKLNKELEDILPVIDLDDFGFMANDDDLMNEVDFSLANAEKADFTVSFTFPIEYKEKVNGIIRYKDKKTVQKMVLDYLLSIDIGGEGSEH